MAAGRPGREVDPGELRHRFVVEEDRGTAQTGRGETIEGWTSLGIRWGSLEWVQGTELWYGQQVVAQATHGVVLRWFEGLNPKHRLKQLTTGRVFEIQSIGDPRGDKHYLFLQVKVRL